MPPTTTTLCLTPGIHWKTCHWVMEKVGSGSLQTMLIDRTPSLGLCGEIDGNQGQTPFRKMSGNLKCHPVPSLSLHPLPPLQNPWTMDNSWDSILSPGETIKISFSWRIVQDQIASLMNSTKYWRRIRAILYTFFQVLKKKKKRDPSLTNFLRPVSMVWKQKPSKISWKIF